MTPSICRNVALRMLGALLLAGCCLPTTLAAQSPSDSTSAAADRATAAAPVDIEKQREEISARLARAQQTVQTLRSSPRRGSIPEALTTEIELLKWLELLYSQQETNKGRLVQLAADKEKLQAELAALRSVGPTESPPVSFLLLDETEDQWHAEQTRRQTLDLELKAAQSLIEGTRKALEENESKRRLARDAVERARDASSRDALVQQHELTRLASRAVTEALRQYEGNVRVHQLEQEISELRCTYLQEKTEALKPLVKFSREDLESKLVFLDRLEDQFREELAAAQSRMRDVDRQWLAARQTVEEASGQDPVLDAKLAAWELAHDSHEEEVSLLSEMLRDVFLIRLNWRRRFEVANQSADIELLHEWLEVCRNGRERLGQLQQLIQLRVDKRHNDQVTLARRLLQVPETDTALRPWIEKQSDELTRLNGIYSSSLLLAKAGDRLLGRFEDELLEQLGPTTKTDWKASLAYAVKTVWNYELTSVEDRPVTVGKILTGLFMLFSGYFLARTLSRVLGRRVFPRIGLNEGGSAAFQTIAFYLMLVCIGFVSLELINIPLTVFAFLGGAVAIGVGFGSQNILNNFISGLILLAERPIRVGDLVDIDGLYGTIEHIGARSTRVKTGANLEIIVPNSKFLENNVTNWTLSDTRSRAVVCVGVAYGSPTATVDRLLRQAVSDHPDVFAEPEPIVLFKEFGDNALHFEIHFWIHMRTVMQGEKIKSSIRHTIDGLFDDANITIAFPQRDVHIDSLSPIEVNIRQPADAGNGSGLRAA